MQLAAPPTHPTTWGSIRNPSCMEVRPVQMEVHHMNAMFSSASPEVLVLGSVVGRLRKQRTDVMVGLLVHRGQLHPLCLIL
eukprot:11872793-Alexandrium_andersonii.AAC.1